MKTSDDISPDYSSIGGRYFSASILVFSQSPLYSSTHWLANKESHIYVMNQKASSISSDDGYANILIPEGHSAPILSLHLSGWSQIFVALCHGVQYSLLYKIMMTSSNGNIFHITGSLCGEFTGHRWIPRTKASDAELWCFFVCPWTYGWVNNR